MSRRDRLPGAGESFVSFIRLFDRRLLWQVLKPYALPSCQRLTGFANAA
jgi:hypothetical protein